MAHARIDVDRLAGIERDRIVEFGGDDNLAAQHEHEFLAGVMDEVAEFLLGLGTDLGYDRDHPLAPKFGAQIIIVVVRGLDAHRISDVAKAATRGHGRRRVVVRLGEQVGHAHAQALAKLVQLVIGQRQPVVLDLRQRRHRNAAALAHLLERPAFAAADTPQKGTERGCWRRHRASLSC